MPDSKIKRAFPPLASDLREALAAGYRLAELRHDLMAGLALGIIAVPLSLSTGAVLAPLDRLGQGETA